MRTNLPGPWCTAAALNEDRYEGQFNCRFASCGCQVVTSARRPVCRPARRAPTIDALLGRPGMLLMLTRRSFLELVGLALMGSPRTLVAGAAPTESVEVVARKGWILVTAGNADALLEALE